MSRGGDQCWAIWDSLVVFIIPFPWGDGVYELLKIDTRESGCRRGPDAPSGDLVPALKNSHGVKIWPPWCGPSVFLQAYKGPWKIPWPQPSGRVPLVNKEDMEPTLQRSLPETGHGFRSWGASPANVNLARLNWDSLICQIGYGFFPLIRVLVTARHSTWRRC